MRGAVLGQLWLSRCGRFIPACAGNGRPACRAASPPPVHPRVCRERLCVTISAQEPFGSSPRVRGTGTHLRIRTDLLRFIPACAGNGSSAGVGMPYVPVHPRVCGERVYSISQTEDEDGSSPRVRGNGQAGDGPLVPLGSIPAGAGERRSARTIRPGSTVYPRGCGGTRTRQTGYKEAWGLSPRVRGNDGKTT